MNPSRLLLALLISALLAAPAATPAPAPPASQARLLGRIPDGTPPPPAPPKPPYTAPRRSVLESVPVTEGGRTITLQRIKPLSLPPPPAPAEYPQAVDPELFRQRLAARRLLHPAPRWLGIGATVYRADGRPTLTRLTCRVLSDRSAAAEQTYWSSGDFSLLAGLGSFADKDGRTYQVFMMWGVIDLDRCNSARRARGYAELPYPSPPIPAGPAAFIPATPGAPATAEALAPIWALHEILNRDSAALLAARQGREAARAAREAWLKANPPQPKDIILNHWDIGGGRPTVPAVIPRRPPTPSKRRRPRRMADPRHPEPRRRKSPAKADRRRGHHIPLIIPILIAYISATLPSAAILDLDGNGISDLTEAAWNGGQPPATPYDPAADPDGDGWDNAREATAGTNPFSGNPTANGFLTPFTEFVPAVYGDEDGDGIDEVLFPETLLLTWTSVPGKAYQVSSTSTLAPYSWAALSADILSLID